jgi:predicted DNA-binding transcriptional regulator AlpA
VNLGKRAVGWVESEIAAHLAELVERSRRNAA